MRNTCEVRFGFSVNQTLLKQTAKPQDFLQYFSQTNNMWLPGLQSESLVHNVGIILLLQDYSHVYPPQCQIRISPQDLKTERLLKSWLHLDCPGHLVGLLMQLILWSEFIYCHQKIRFNYPIGDSFWRNYFNELECFSKPFRGEASGPRKQ